MKTLIFVIVLFVCMPLWALPQKSFLCENQAPNQLGITCCLDNSRLCGDLIQSLLSDEQTSAIQSIHKQVMRGELGIRTPNCFYTALRFSKYQKKLRLSSYDQRQFSYALKSEYFEIQAGQMRKGDLVVFFEGGKQRTPRFGKSGALERVDWVYTEKPLHAAIYLGSGAVFQKEDMYSAVFSVSTLKHAYQTYEKNMVKNDPYFKEARFLRRSFRHNSQR